MLGWKRSGVQKKKRWVSSYLFFFFVCFLVYWVILFVAVVAVVFLLYLLCFFTLHGCYLKVTYKELAHHP